MSATEGSESSDASPPGTGGPSRKSLGVFVLAMINVAAVLSLRNFPSMSEYGWASVFWIFLGTILFLVPVSLVGAELASAWPKSTGVYDWVTEGLGERSGFLGIWSEWTENIVWFPTVLVFLSATFAYVLTPSLANNKVYLFVTMLGTFWIVTFFNLFGDRWSGVISSVGSILGSILPGAIIIVLGIGWLVAGEPSEIPYDGASSFIPTSFDFSTLALVATVILLYAGMEMAGYHALETRNPQRDFPRAMFISAVIIFVITSLGTLAIAFVVPQQDINLVSGLMQAFQDFFDQLGIGWATRPMAFLVFVGGVAQLSTWIIGPAKGLQGATRDGLLPPVWARENRHGVPVGVVMLQGLLATLFSLLFLFVPGVSGAYWILSALTTQVICIMYFLIFVSAIRLRYSQADQPRPYRIPGGTPGMWLVAGMGAVSVIFSFVVGFFPPSQITTIPGAIYPAILGAGIIVLSVPPFLFYWFRKPSWLEPVTRSVRFAGVVGESATSAVTDEQDAGGNR